MGFKYTYTVRVEWGDSDPAKIVFYPNYFRWFDIGTNSLFREAGYPPEVAWDEFGIVGIPLVHAEADFRGPARFADLLTVESEVAKIEGKRIHVTHAITNNGQPIISGLEIRALVVEVTKPEPRLKSMPIPERMQKVLLQL